MNWLKKTLDFGQKIKRLLKKRASRKDMEESPWTSCCKGPILKKDLEDNLWCCPLCNKHHRITCIERFDAFFGKGNYQILKTPISNNEDPLLWHDKVAYSEKLEAAKKKTKQDCAIMVATGKVNNIEVVAASSNMAFLGGSVSISEAEALVYAVQHAIDNNKSFINFCSGGGMRMMTSAIALNAGMVKTTLAINELKKKKLPYIVCFCDPVTGGILASYASTGDITLSEVDALAGFAGRRVIEGTVKEQLPENFQKADHVLSCGFIDAIVHRKDLPEKIGILLSILLKKNSAINSEKNETSENSQSLTKAAS